MHTRVVLALFYRVKSLCNVRNILYETPLYNNLLSFYIPVNKIDTCLAFLESKVKLILLEGKIHQNSTHYDCDAALNLDVLRRDVISW